MSRREGGVTSGIDLALDFVSFVSVREVVGKIQLMIEYFPSQVSFQLQIENILVKYLQNSYFE